MDNKWDLRRNDKVKYCGETYIVKGVHGDDFGEYLPVEIVKESSLNSDMVSPTVVNIDELERIE